MSAVIPPGFGQARFQIDVPGRSGDVMNIVGYSSETDLDPFDQAARLAGFYGDTFLGAMSDTATLLGVTVIYNNAGTLTEGFFVAGVPGSESGDVMPPNCAVLVRKVTNFPGRQNRGRLYMPAIPKEDVQNAGLYEDTPRASLQTDLDNEYASLLGDGYAFAILHDEDGPYAADDPTAVVLLYVEQKIATQRTRLRD